MTATLYNVFQSELIKRGLNEFETDSPATDVFEMGKFVFYDDDYQFMTKILTFDDDIQDITNELFMGVSLENKEHDTDFKRRFIAHFITRRINRQTIEAFKLALLSTFMGQKGYIARLYEDLEKYVSQLQTSDNQNKQTNKQKNDGSTLSDNRSAFADTPQSSVNLNVDDTDIDYATDNTITRNRQTNNQQTDGETTGNSNTESRSYHLDELIKSSGLMGKVLDNFDIKCFMQTW